MRNDPTKCSVCGFGLGEPGSPLGPSGVDRRRHMVCPAHSPFRVEPRLSLAEIEARLTYPVQLAASGNARQVQRLAPDDFNREHRAWLDVILTALGEEER